MERSFAACTTLWRASFLTWARNSQRLASDTCFPLFPPLSCQKACVALLSSFWAYSSSLRVRSSFLPGRGLVQRGKGPASLT
jgi:hypothetical protein